MTETTFVDHPRPQTARELSTLPEGGGFGIEERVIDGKTYRVPVLAEERVAGSVNDEDVISWVDGDDRWQLGRYADGQWFKRRV